MQSDITHVQPLEGGCARPVALNILRVTDVSENMKAKKLSLEIVMHI